MENIRFSGGVKVNSNTRGNLCFDDGTVITCDLKITEDLDYFHNNSIIDIEIKMDLQYYNIIKKKIYIWQDVIYKTPSYEIVFDKFTMQNIVYDQQPMILKATCNHYSFNKTLREIRSEKLKRILFD